MLQKLNLTQLRKSLKKLLKKKMLAINLLLISKLGFYAFIRI